MGGSVDFTGKERDSESGLDYFGARHYGSALGRFTRPDEFWKDSHALKSGAQNVIGISNGNASATGDSYVSPKGLWTAITGGADRGVWNINNLGNGVAAHEFTHLLGVDDRTSGTYLSNTNLLNDPSVSRHATPSDLGWGVREATQSVGLTLGFKNIYNGQYGPLPTPFTFSTTGKVGAPVGPWWK